MNPNTSAQALSNLQQTQAQSQDPNSILSGQRQQLGVNAAQDTVTGLRGAINNTTQLLKQVAPSVMGRTGNSLVTNAQATKQISNEQAPISQNLTEQNTQYGQASQDLSELQQRAQEAASGIYQGQQDKLSYAQNLYNTLYKQEQDAQTARQADADRQESIRQFNEGLALQKAAAKASGSSFNLPGATASGGAQMQQRSGGGFNFQSSGGQGISAAAYSQAKGVPIRQLLSDMAKAGDAGAKTALDYVGDDYGVNKAKLKNLMVSPNAYNKTVSLLKSLGFSV
jgi:hypothetical protein